MTDLQKQLLAQLRALKPHKIRDKLRRGNCYCIQGAMCEAYRLVKPDENVVCYWTDRDEFVSQGKHDFLAYYSRTIPNSVMRAFGLEHKHMLILEQLNDTTNTRMRDLINKLAQMMREPDGSGYLPKT